jgi:hypothetical protein
VKTGRESDKNCEDEPKWMKKLLMDFCGTMVGRNGAGDVAQQRSGRGKTVEADWGSDED